MQSILRRMFQIFGHGEVGVFNEEILGFRRKQDEDQARFVAANLASCTQDVILDEVIKKLP